MVCHNNGHLSVMLIDHGLVIHPVIHTYTLRTQISIIRIHGRCQNSQNIIMIMYSSQYGSIQKSHTIAIFLKGFLKPFKRVTYCSQEEGVN